MKKIKKKKEHKIKVTVQDVEKPKKLIIRRSEFRQSELNLKNLTGVEIEFCDFNGANPKLSITLDTPISVESYHKLLQHLNVLREIFKIDVELIDFKIINKLV